MDETEATKAEIKATYAPIQAYIEKKQVKQRLGMIGREYYNVPKSEDGKQPKCSPKKGGPIKAALEHFQMF